MVDIAGKRSPDYQRATEQELFKRLQESSSDHLVSPDDKTLFCLELEIEFGDVFS